MIASEIETNAPSPLTPDQQEQLALILDEYLGAIEQGVAPELDKLCDQHPDLADAIRHYVKSLNLLQDAACNVLETDAAKRKALNVSAKEIGDYRLIREIGRGGMGVVYEAQQISLERRVALKVLPFAAVLDSRQITRFQNEAQAAAQLHHPNIVPVYAIGSDRGTYFYSMQYIEGKSLDYAIAELHSGLEWHLSGPQVALHESGNRDVSTLFAIPLMQSEEQSHCESVPETNTIDLNDRASTVRSIRTRNHVHRVAELGVQAAEALHFAHQNGIIHRDIKPSNLLVDQNTKLWITDFGLAQCGRLGNLTRSGDVVGTLRYMSPEQAAGKTHWVDNRTDIYSLGLTLYELLTLCPVVDATDRIAMLRQIESSEPQGARRRNPAVPIDLENIILKAISKQREDRYATAGEFAEDLKRFLSGRTPLAKRPSVIDRSARWVAKHARGVAIGAVVLVCTCIATGIVASMLGAKNVEIQSANHRAIKHLNVANNVVDRFGADLLSKLELIPGTEELQRDVAQSSIEYLKAFTEYASRDASMGDELGRAWLKLASLHELLGADAEAHEAYRQAETCLGSERNANSNGHVTDELFTCWNNSACLLTRIGSFDDAATKIKSYIRHIEQSHSQTREDTTTRSRRLALLRLNLGSLYRERDEKRSAEAEFEKALAELNNASGGAHENFELRQMLVFALLQFGATDSVASELKTEALTSALGMAETAVRERPGQWSVVHQMCVCQLALGSDWSQRKDPLKAKVWFEKGACDLKRIWNRHPSNTKLASDYASAMNNLGQAELASEFVVAAKLAFEESMRVLERLAVASSDYLIQSNLGGVLHNLASVAETQGDLGMARRYLARAIESQKLALRSAPDSKRCQQFLEQHQTSLDRISQKIATTGGGNATTGD